MVAFARAVLIARSIQAAGFDEKEDLWQVIAGDELYTSILIWCKAFGTDSEEQHWKKLVPNGEHAAFRAGLLVATGLTADSWAAYRADIKSWRDNEVAHEGDKSALLKVPDMTAALSAAVYFYDWLAENGSPRPKGLAGFIGMYERRLGSLVPAATAATALAFVKTR